MRAILYVTSGPHAGQQAEIQHGRSILVGSAPPARLMLDKDSQLASVHFMVEFVSQTCRVSDMRTETGTFVNKERLVSKVEAADGAAIAAGASEFLLRFGDGNLSSDMETAKPAEPRQAPVPLRANATVQMPKPAPAPLSPRDAAIRCGECMSGLWRYEPTEAGILPWELVKRLSETFTVCATVDAIKLGLAQPADIDTPVYLFSWLSEEAAPLTSPIILCPDDTREFGPIVRTDWGNDGVVIICSEETKETVIEHIRRMARVPAAGKAPSERNAARGSYIPSVFSAMLTYTRPEEIKGWFELLSAIVLESDSPGEWQIFAPREFGEALARLGFELQQPIATGEEEDS